MFSTLPMCQLKATVMTGSPVEIARLAGVDVSTVRRDIQRGCAGIVRRGKRGPTNGAVLDLEPYLAWRCGHGHESAMPDVDELIRAIATDLAAVLVNDKADVRVGVSRSSIMKIQLMNFERIARRYGKTYRPNELPDPIRALLPVL